MVAFRALAIAAALALLLGACVRGNHIRVDSTDDLAPPDSVFVEVVNDNYYDARIYVVYESGARHPIGTVGGNRRQEPLAIPWLPRPLVVEVRLVIEGSVYHSHRVDVARGDIIEVRVPPNIDRSGFFRRVS